MANTRSSIGDSLIFISGAAIGAGIMALVDPSRGAARRGFLRGKFVHISNIAGRELVKQAKNAQNHIVGTFAEQRAKMREGRVDDERLEERVKAQIGHALTHFSVTVRAQDGHVIVEGPVMRGEQRKISERLQQTRGVRSYECRVIEHETAEGLPNLQGLSRPQRQGIA